MGACSTSLYQSTCTIQFLCCTLQVVWWIRPIAFPLVQSHTRPSTVPRLHVHSSTARLEPQHIIPPCTHATNSIARVKSRMLQMMLECVRLDVLAPSDQLPLVRPRLSRANSPGSAIVSVQIVAEGGLGALWARSPPLVCEYAMHSRCKLETF